MKSLFVNKQILIATFILATVFLLDIILPVTIAVGVLYLFCFFIISRQPKKVIIGFVAAVIVLSLIKFIFFLPPTSTYMIFVNRSISIAVIIGIVFITYKRRTQFEHFYKERNDYEQELEEMLFMISHEVRRPITNCIGLMDHLESDTSYTEEELKEMVKHLKVSVFELDDFTRKLIVFVDDIKQKEQIHLNE